MVKEKQLCTNCLRAGHQVTARRTSKCRIHGKVNLVTNTFAKKYALTLQASRTTITGIATGSYDSPASVDLHLSFRFNDYALNLKAEFVVRIPYNISSKESCLDDSLAVPFIIGNLY
ncbi:hypothetical protein PGB90_007773 [Kerria lacca]